MKSPAHAQESIAKGALFAASLFVIVAMAAIVCYLAYQGLQLFFVDHISPLVFLGSANFSPDARHPGALVFIVGSLAITLFAIAVGAPFGIAVGIFLSQLAPKRLAEIMKPSIEILVG
ncbi:MAG: phosphate ABC transporter permease subunit PstC, partial [Candidatus Eremiobacteraeota bacterium]|nr:phosphate ABC transporter permease subunit PstC [Candidatus Eremiobacteraeota bacterium]